MDSAEKIHTRIGPIIGIWQIPTLPRRATEAAHSPLREKRDSPGLAFCGKCDRMPRMSAHPSPSKIIPAPPAEAWTAPDGIVMGFRRWLPKTEPRAMIVAMHGLGGASTDFVPLADFLAPRGIAILAPEMRGQGNDPRPECRGDLTDCAHLTRDLHAFVDHARSLHPEIPWFLYGESMGALIVLAGAADPDRPCPAGTVLASPVVEPDGKLKPWQRMLLTLMIWALPKLRIDPARLVIRNKAQPRMTRDDSAEDRIRQAPHRVRWFTLRFFAQLERLLHSAQASAPSLREPVLVLYAGCDVFVKADAVERFLPSLGSKEVCARLYPGAYHMLLHDYDRDAVLDDLRAWLEPRCA